MATLTVDLAMYLPNPDGTTSQELATSTYPNGLIAFGSSKLVQRFLIYLMTEKGSQYYSTDGSSFLTLLRGNSCCSWQIISDFSLALLDIEQSMENEELATDDPSEKYAGASLDNILLSHDSVTLSISIRNQANTAEQILLPLAFKLN